MSQVPDLQGTLTFAIGLRCRMGLGKEIARKGAIGSTARWGAQAFFSYLGTSRFGDFSNDEQLRNEIDKLVSYALKIRFDGDLSTKDASLIDQMYRSSGRQLGYSGFINCILAVEAGLYKNTKENISMFTDLVEEELELANVGAAVIYGEVNAKPRHAKPETKKSPWQANKSGVSTSDKFWATYGQISIYVMALGSIWLIIDWLRS